MKSNSGKLTAWTNTGENPIHLEDDQPPHILQEEDSEEISLDNLPEYNEKRSKRGREEDAIFVHSDESDEDDEDNDAFETQNAPPPKRAKLAGQEEQPPTDDKKKLGLKTAYDGFGIYGRILCLIVKRRGVKRPTAEGPSTGSEMLENWVSTQAQRDDMLDNAEDG